MLWLLDQATAVSPASSNGTNPMTTLSHASTHVAYFGCACGGSSWPGVNEGSTLTYIHPREGKEPPASKTSAGLAARCRWCHPARPVGRYRGQRDYSASAHHQDAAGLQAVHSQDQPACLGL